MFLQPMILLKREQMLFLFIFDIHVHDMYFFSTFKTLITDFLIFNFSNLSSNQRCNNIVTKDAEWPAYLPYNVTDHDGECA